MATFKFPNIPPIVATGGGRNIGTLDNYDWEGNPNFSEVATALNITFTGDSANKLSQLQTALNSLANHIEKSEGYFQQLITENMETP